MTEIKKRLIKLVALPLVLVGVVLIVVSQLPIEKWRQERAAEQIIEERNSGRTMRALEASKLSRQSLAPWGIGMPQTNPSIDGWPTVIDRFVVFLHRGQQSQPLPYIAPPWLPGEEDKFIRKWSLRPLVLTTLIAEVNGIKVVSAKTDKDVRLGQETKGRFVIVVELGEDAELETAPVEFIYYREKIEKGDK